MIQPGDILENIYRVDKKIGQGGAGIVYLGYHLRLDKQIVIKKIKDGYVGKIQERAEADILKQLHHTNLPQVYDFVQNEKEVFTVMEYVEGEDLGYYIKRKIKPEENQLFNWMKQLCEVLEYLHTRKPAVIHNDIKPQNIMLRSDGTVCLIDFNISFDESKEVISGYSRRYASPELLEKSRKNQVASNILIDDKSDLYSLGATMYHLVSGIAPEAEKDKNPSLLTMDLPYSEALLGIISRAMSISREERYDSASEMLSDLLNIQTRNKELCKLKKKQIVFNILCSGFLIAGVAGVFCGQKIMTEEDFQKEYQYLTEQALTEDFAQTIKDCMDLLNEKKYQRVLENREEQKANLFYMIANSYFEQQQYQDAEEYYQKAISLVPSYPSYYRDCAIARARMKDTEKAEAILEKAIQQGLDTDQIHFTYAEIALAEENYQEAFSILEDVIHKTNNREIKSRAILLYADGLGNTGDREKKIKILEDAVKEVEDSYKNTVKRKLGAAYLEEVERQQEESIRLKYCEKAIQCYANLVQNQSATWNDQMNLAILYQLQESFTKSREVLLDMLELYPGDYRIPMRLALLVCVEEGKKEPEHRDYGQVEKYYHKAEKLYKRKKNSGEGDENMKNLKNIIEQLYEGGWLEE